jgi:NADP-dependent alcohol dehydrogenase
MLGGLRAEDVRRLLDAALGTTATRTAHAANAAPTANAVPTALTAHI